MRVRITAGERILSMQSKLQHQNALIQDTLDELKGLYAAINSDLIEAQKLQLRTKQQNTNARLAEVAELMARARVGLFPKTPPSTRSAKSGAAQQTPEELGKRAKALEKGWIDHIGKWDTHNALIGKTQRARTAA